MFGPPLSREITSHDIEFAFRRMATESIIAQYEFYYDGLIDGLDPHSDTTYSVTPEDISGIETPDDKTIIFHLTRVSPDFVFLVAMPATMPMPEEVAGCFTVAGEYGRYVVSSGPYMYEGSDALDASSCDALMASGPISGFDPEDHSYFVRNPDYDPATDDPEVRANCRGPDHHRPEHQRPGHLRQDPAPASWKAPSRRATRRPTCSQNYATDPALQPMLRAGW